MMMNVEAKNVAPLSIHTVRMGTHQDNHRNVSNQISHMSSYKSIYNVCVCVCVILTKIGIYWQILVKTPNINLSSHPLGWG
jgi:hypothetical protein